MEFLIAVGSGIVTRVVEYTVVPVVRQVSYLTHSKSNLHNLETKVEELVAARAGVQHDVDQAVRTGKRIQPVVENWKTRVDAKTEEATRFLKDERHAQTTCLHGLCPNLMLRYRLSKKSTKLIDEVVKLAEKEFPHFTYDIPLREVCSISTGDSTTFDSRILTMKKIMEELKNPDTEMILVYGIGGVGKTTLAEEVLRQAIEDKLFEDVVMVRDVKENPDLGRIQREIATKLGLEVSDNQTVFERAPLLCNRIKEKKTLVILDDVWEALDLVTMGLPRVATCKILLTCRSRKELSLDSRKQTVFPLDILGEEEAWSLFEKMASDIVKEDQSIRKIAIQVAKRCGGLPVLLVTVARALKYRTTLPPWKDALRRLKRLDNEELTTKAYSALEWSYNQLDEELKPLFLLCGTNLHANTVYLSDLLKYGMGLGLFNNVETIEEAQNALYSLVEKLKDFGLLLDHNDDRFVRMHDLVRDVALSIASKEAHTLSVAYGGELKEWPTEDFLQKCSSISLNYCTTPRLPEVLQCPELKMFHLARRNIIDDMQGFPCKFFQVMIELNVLDLTGLRLIPSLPPSLVFLKNLRTLCLDGCELGDISLVGQLGSLEILSLLQSKVKRLPKETGQLTRLRLLDLTDCHDLEVIPPNVISSLKRLEDLRMKNSFKQWEDERVIEERRNASLSELKNLSHLTALEIRIPDANSLPADLFSNECLERYHISIGDSHLWNDWDNSSYNSLNLKLSISNDLDRGLQMLLKNSGALCLDGTEGAVKEGFPQHRHIINSKVQLSNLTTLKVLKCDGKFLFSSYTARSLIQLKHLQVSGCPLLEEIVSTEEFSEEIDTDRDIMFPKLEHVELRDLPNLARFCSGNCIEFPTLQILELKDCSNLRAFVSDPVCENNVICNEIEEADSKENSSLDDKITISLFDEKVRLPRLKRLYVALLPKLMTIWTNQLPPEIDLQNLNSVEIWACDSLRNICPASLVLRGLQQLENLKVDYCRELEEIITKEVGVETTPPPEFLFPKVTSMHFIGQDKLRSFYAGMHVLKMPLLNHLAMNNCDGVKLGAGEKHELDHDSAPIQLSMFMIEKDSFRNLQSLTLDGEKIWNDVLAVPAEYFSRLKTITFYGWSPFFSNQFSPVLVFLQNLHHLEELQVRHHLEELEEIFVDQANSSGSSSTHQLPRVRHLKLDDMSKLMHLGGAHNSEPAAAAVPVFPQLESLKVLLCGRLKNLESSAISFRNLTTLTVCLCNELEYLTTYVAAKSLMQLTTLKVECCERMTEIFIVASSNQNGDDDAGGNQEIVFQRLQYLTLRTLPRLQVFCSGNCIVRFPSLQTLLISKRLKLKIFPHHDETLRIRYKGYDTEVDDVECEAKIGENNNAKEDEVIKQ